MVEINRAADLVQSEYAFKNDKFDDKKLNYDAITRVSQTAVCGTPCTTWVLALPLVKVD